MSTLNTTHTASRPRAGNAIAIAALFTLIVVAATILILALTAGSATNPATSPTAVPATGGGDSSSAAYAPPHSLRTKPSAEPPANAVEHFYGLGQ